MMLEDNKDLELIEKQFVLLWLIVLDDPTRGREVNIAVSDWRNAGINIRVISGDSIEATKAVAKETGILCDFDEMLANQIALEGFEFRNRVGGIITHSRKTRWGKEYVKNEYAFREIIKELKVLACAGSEDKHLLVTGLKNEGFTVGVSGISPADTKSLLKADVGFSLNELGSEVAKHSSDIILKNDSLTSVVASIMWGRNLYMNIKRFSQYYLTFSIVLAFTVLISVIIEGHVPFNIFHLLWLHIVSDFFADWALARESPSYTALLEKPVDKEKKLFTQSMWRNVILNSVYQIIVLAVVNHEGDSLFDAQIILSSIEWNPEDGLIYTILFQIFFYFQISNIILSYQLKSYEYNIIKGIYKTIHVLVPLIIIELLLVTYGGKYLKLTNFNLGEHCFTAVIGLSPLIVLSILRWIIPIRFFKFKLKDTPMEWSEVQRWIQHFFRKTLTVPSKIPVKQKWRSNSQNQYDTKGKKNITWEDDEEANLQEEETKVEKVDLQKQLRDNFRRQEDDFVKGQTIPA